MSGKFIQLAVTANSERDFPAIYALDDEGHVWRWIEVEGTQEWERLPPKRQAIVEEELEF